MSVFSGFRNGCFARGLGVRRMFQYKPAVFVQNILRENQIRKFPGVAHAEGWVGKDDVKSSMAIFDVTESITSYGMHHIGKMFFRELFDKLNARRIIVNTGNAGATARKKFVGYVSRSAKKVKDFYLRKIKMIVQDIEEGGFGKVRGRAHGQIARSANGSAFLVSAYNAHRCWLSKG